MIAAARRVVLPVLLALALSGCGPRVAAPGPGPTTPALVDNGFIARDGMRLPLRRWMPEEGEPWAVLLALHGMNDYGAFMDLAAPTFTKAGIAVYAPDQRGFGAAPERGIWAGIGPMTRDVTDLARLLRVAHPGATLHLLGESMGGAVAMTALGGAEPPPVDGAILSAPAVWGRDAMPGTHRISLYLVSNLMPSMILTGQGMRIRASDNEAMLRDLGRDPMVIKGTRADAILGLVDMMDAAMEAAPRIDAPVLFLYGAKDELIPAEPSRRAVMSMPDLGGRQRLAVYPEGWHMLLRDKQAGMVRDDIIAWLKDSRAPLPSGVERKYWLPGEEPAFKVPPGGRAASGAAAVGE